MQKKKQAWKKLFCSSVHCIHTQQFEYNLVQNCFIDLGGYQSCMPLAKEGKAQNRQVVIRTIDRTRVEGSTYTRALFMCKIHQTWRSMVHIATYPLSIAGLILHRGTDGAPCPLVIAFGPLKSSNRNLQFPNRMPFTKENMPRCPCPFQKGSIQAWYYTITSTQIGKFA